MQSTVVEQEPRAAWLSPAGAARRLGCSPSTIRNLVGAGKLSAWRSPLGRLVPAADVERLAVELQGAKQHKQFSA